MQRKFPISAKTFKRKRHLAKTWRQTRKSDDSHVNNLWASFINQSPKRGLYSQISTLSTRTLSVFFVLKHVHYLLSNIVMRKMENNCKEFSLTSFIEHKETFWCPLSRTAFCVTCCTGDEEEELHSPSANIVIKNIYSTPFCMLSTVSLHKGGHKILFHVDAISCCDNRNMHHWSFLKVQFMRRCGLLGNTC